MKTRIIAAVALLLSGGDDSTATIAPEVSNNDSRVAFLKGFGWEVTTSPVESGQVKIPQNSSEVFDRYNALQKKAGFDLEDYRGKTVKKYTYKILNYPSAEKDDIIKADLLVLDGRVIGGDIYSPRLDGFIMGLEARRNVEK